MNWTVQLVSALINWTVQKGGKETASPTKSHPTYRKNKATQGGVALIVVMLIVALITILAVEMSARLQINIARTINVKANNQAFWYAMGAEQFAKSSLSTLQSATSENINLSQPWAEDFAFPVEGGSIEARLTDLQACFNLNAINSNPPAPNTPVNGPSPSQQAFLRLLENFIEDTYQAETIRDSLIDWIDEDDIPSSLGAEDSDYESLPIPYLTANSAMSNLSEIRLINGIEAIAQSPNMKNISNALCVLPETDIQINVNTVTEENAVVLSALLGQTLQVGIDIVSNRPEQGFDDIEDFFQSPEVKAIAINTQQKPWFAVTTKYFRLDTRAKFQGTQFRMSTIFKLESDNVTVISREFGGAF